MSKAKVIVNYKDGSSTRITCESFLIAKYVAQSINKDSVRKLTSQIYPFKNNPQVVHKDVDSGKCKYSLKGPSYIKCTKNNDPDDSGQCIFEDGIININAPCLCSEAILLKMEIKEDLHDLFKSY